MARLTCLLAFVAAAAVLLSAADAAEKRQFFDSLGGMALGKRSAHHLASFLENPEVVRMLGQHMSKRRIMDGLGGGALLSY